jgi:hypothetical protein
MALLKHLAIHYLTIHFLLILTSALPGPSPGLSLNPRADAFWRGWALSHTGDCPADTKGCGKGQCCPDDSYCYTTSDTLSNICCPTGYDCAYHIALDSRCADTDWVLWTTRHDPICCLPGQLGVQPAPDDWYGECVPGTSKVPAASLATKVSKLHAEMKPLVDEAF